MTTEAELSSLLNEAIIELKEVQKTIKNIRKQLTLSEDSLIYYKNLVERYKEQLRVYRATYPSKCKGD